MKLGYIGLGKMGQGMVLRLAEHGHHIIAYDASDDARKALEKISKKIPKKKGVIEIASSVEELTLSLVSPRVIWLMVPHTVVDIVLQDLTRFTKPGDTIIDGGNSFYADSIRRADTLANKKIKFLDAGTSGGPHGARNGACVMVGGKSADYKKLETLFRDISAGEGYYAHFEGHGAGHFIKMVHNGIEYGMMQAIAEGFALMKKSPYRPNLLKIADLYNHGSVVESHLVEWLAGGFRAYGEDLKDVSGTVGATGEGEWTVKTAKKLGIPAPVIKNSFEFRVKSKQSPSYTGKLLSAMRNQFGGHNIK